MSEVDVQQIVHGFGVGIACKNCSVCLSVCLHAGIVQEANLSMVHLASNKASEQHTLWQVRNVQAYVHCCAVPLLHTSTAD